LGLGEAIGGEKIFRGHVEDLSLLEAGRIDSFCRFDAEVEGIDRAENFIDWADLGLVFEVHTSVELGEAAHVCALDHELIFGLVKEGAIRDDVGGRTVIEATAVVIEGAASASAAAATAERSSLEAAASVLLEFLAHLINYNSTVAT